VLWGMRCAAVMCWHESLLATTSGSHGVEVPWGVSALGGNLYFKVHVKQRCFFSTQNVMQTKLLLALF